MWQIYAFTAHEMVNGRHREEAALAAERRRLGQLDDGRVLAQPRPAAAGRSVLARLAGAFRKGVADEHSLTDYPCRLPDGAMGRVAVVGHGGDWNLVCRRT